MIPTGRDFGLAEWINTEGQIGKNQTIFQHISLFLTNDLPFCQFFMRTKIVTEKAKFNGYHRKN